MNDFESRREELIQKLKTTIKRKAVVFETGGFKPTYQKGESWIGNVCWQKPGEEQPVCRDIPFPMCAMATFFVPESDYVPRVLKNIKLITVFMDNAFWDNLDADDLKDYFVIRTYESLDDLVPCDYADEEMVLPFPLSAKNVDDDFAKWEDLELYLPKISDIISKLEDDDFLEYYDDIFEENYPMHKLGGYPSTIQSEIMFNSGCEFAFQISSDEKADMNIVDSGNIYFGYNPKTKEWSVKCDFY